MLLKHFFFSFFLSHFLDLSSFGPLQLDELLLIVSYTHTLSLSLSSLSLTRTHAHSLSLSLCLVSLMYTLSLCPDLSLCCDFRLFHVVTLLLVQAVAPHSDSAAASSPINHNKHQLQSQQRFLFF